MQNPIRRVTSRFSRRTKIVTGIITTLLVVPAVAMAAFFSFNLGVGGSVKAGSFSYTMGGVQLFTAADSGGLPAGQADICGGVSNTTTALTITPGTGGLPGDVCKMHVPIISAGNSSNGTISGLLLPGLPKGWTASLVTTAGTDACGTTIAGASGTTQSDVLVITVDPNGTTGTFTGSTFALGSGAIQVAPSAQAPASPVCTVAGTA